MSAIGGFIQSFEGLYFQDDEMVNVEKLIADFEELISEINSKRSDNFITFEKDQNGAYVFTDNLLSKKEVKVIPAVIFDLYVFYQYMKLMF